MLYYDARSTNHQDIDVTFGVQVRYRLKNGETEATGKRRRVVNVERRNKKSFETNINLSKTTKRGCAFESNVPRFPKWFCFFFWEVLELGSVLPSGKRAICRWKKKIAEH